MNFFEPQLTLFRVKKNRYTLQSVTMTPHGCYFAGKVVNGPPDGMIVIPEAIAFQLHLGEQRSAACPMVLTPVTHRVPSLNLTPAKNSVVCFVILNGAVVGSASVSTASSHQVHAAPAAKPKPFLAAALGDDDGILSFAEAQAIILNNVPDRSTFNGDTTILLRLLGIVNDDPFGEALKDDIVEDLRGSFSIDRSLIATAPDDSLNKCIQSVVNNVY